MIIYRMMMVMNQRMVPNLQSKLIFKLVSTVVKTLCHYGCSRLSPRTAVSRSDGDDTVEHNGAQTIIVSH